MKALIIPEDPRNDEYTLRPLLKAMASRLDFPGRPKLKIEICTDPILGGISNIFRIERIRDIVEMYPLVDVFILCVDRDGVLHRRASLDYLVQSCGEFLRPTQRMIAAQAWEEIEIWILAGMDDLPPQWVWSAVRAEVSLKETYFNEYVRYRGLQTQPRQGRKFLAELAARNYGRIKQLCSEDFGALEADVRGQLLGSE